MALGLDQPEGNTMRQPPRNSKESIFARGLGWKILSRGILIGLSTWAVFALSLDWGMELQGAQTMAFSTLVMAQLIHVFDCRSEKSVFHRNPLQNKYLVLSVISSVLLLVGVIYWEPAQQVFKTIDLTVSQWLWILLFAAIPTFLVGFIRLLVDAFRK
jgi:Ca2+-transporting ATPase